MKRRTLTKIIFILIGLVLLIHIGMFTYSFFGNTGGAFIYSDGERIGYITKLSTNKGWVFKTVEGELNMGAFQRNQDASSSISGTVFSFSVTDDTIIKKLQQSIDHDSKVKLFYHQVKFRNPTKGDSDYFVYKVEEIK